MPVKTGLRKVIRPPELRVGEIHGGEELCACKRGVGLKQREPEEHLPAENSVRETHLTFEPAPGKAGSRTESRAREESAVFKCRLKKFRHPIERGSRAVDGASKDRAMKARMRAESGSGTVQHLSELRAYPIGLLRKLRSR